MSSAKSIRELSMSTSSISTTELEVNNEALRVAAQCGNINELQRLLPHSNAKALNKDGWTALHFAAEYGHTDCVKSLLQASDCKAKNKKGWTALALALRRGNIECASVIEAFKRKEAEREDCERETLKREEAEQKVRERETPRRIKAGMQRIIDHAISKGGRCLSTHFKNLMQEVKFECAQGHIFEARANRVRFGGQWCPECALHAATELQNESPRSDESRANTEITMLAMDRKESGPHMGPGKPSQETATNGEPDGRGSLGLSDG